MINFSLKIWEESKRKGKATKKQSKNLAKEKGNDENKDKKSQNGKQDGQEDNCFGKGKNNRKKPSKSSGGHPNHAGRDRQDWKQTGSKQKGSFQDEKCYFYCKNERGRYKEEKHGCS